MKFFFLCLFFHLFLILNSQITIEPTVNLAAALLSVDGASSDSRYSIENNFGRIHGFGFELSSHISKNIIISLNSNLSQMVHNAEYCIDDPSFIHKVSARRSLVSRWNNGVFFDRRFKKQISLGIGLHAIYQPYINGAFFGRDAQAYRVSEFGLSSRIKFHINKLSLSLHYYHGLKNRGGLFYYYDPFKTIGLELGYPFVVKRKR